MRAVIQRVNKASVEVDNHVIGQIQSGFLVLLGVEQGDQKSDADYLVKKISQLRVFEDEFGKMNVSILETSGQILVVSQFTLLGDCRKGRRPSFVQAASPDLGKELYLYFVSEVEKCKIPTATGEFGAQMQVHLVNDGPVTLIIDSRKI